MGLSSDILLTIGTKVGGATELNSFISLLGRLKTVTIDAWKSAEELNDAMAASTTKIGDAYAATGGLISAMDLYRASNKASMAGLNLTEQQLRSLAVAAAKYADVTGTDAKSAMDALSSAVAKGSARALKDYGIELQTTGGLAEKQAEAIAKLTQKFGDQTIQAGNLSESFESLANSAKLTSASFVKFLGDASGINKFFGDLSAGVAKSIAAYERMGGRDMQAATDLFAEHSETALNRVAGSWLKVLPVVNFVNEAIGRTLATVEVFGTKTGQAELAAAGREATRKRINDLKLDAKFAAWAQGGVGAEQQSLFSFSTESPAAPKEKKSGGGGGGRSFGGNLSGQAAQDALLSQLIGAPTGEAGLQDLQGLDLGTAGAMGDAQGMMDSVYALEEARLKNLELSYLENASLEQKSAIELDFQAQRAALLQEQIDAKLTMVDTLGYDPENPEYIQSMIEIEGLRSQLFVENKGKEAQSVSEFEKIFTDRIGKATAKQVAMNGALDIFSNAFRAGMNAAIFGGKSISQAIAESVKATAAGYMIESTLKGMFEIAEAIRIEVSTFGAGSALAAAHMSSAAQYFATAAFCGGIAGIASAAMGSSDSKLERKGGRVANAPREDLSGSFSSTSATDTPREVRIVVSADGDEFVDGLLKVNGKRAKSGKKGFAVAG